MKSTHAAWVSRLSATGGLLILVCWASQPVSQGLGYSPLSRQWRLDGVLNRYAVSLLLDKENDSAAPLGTNPGWDAWRVLDSDDDIDSIWLPSAGRRQEIHQQTFGLLGSGKPAPVQPTTYFLHVPYWVIALASSCVSAIALIRHRRFRNRPGYCPSAAMTCAPRPSDAPNVAW